MSNQYFLYKKRLALEKYITFTFYIYEKAEWIIVNVFELYCTQHS